MGKSPNVDSKYEEMQQQKYTYIELPKLNPNIDYFDEDILYHIALGSKSHDLPKIFGDTKFVVLGGTPKRMENFAYYIMRKIGYKLPPGTMLNDISRLSHRYAMYKVGPVLSVSHGMGMPSIGILINELIKLMYHAKVENPIFIRIGTSGGLNVLEGTVIITENLINDFLEPYYEMTIFGNIMEFPGVLDREIINEMYSLSKKLPFPIRRGTTFCSNNFYEGSGRLDGAICDFSHEESREFYSKLTDIGVVNTDMESMAFAALTHRAGIKSAAVTVVLSDRMETDSIKKSKELLDEWQLRPFKLVGEFIKNRLKNQDYSTKTQAHQPVPSEANENLKSFDSYEKTWSDSSRKSSPLANSASPLSEAFRDYLKVGFDSTNSCKTDAYYHSSFTTDVKSLISQSMDYLQCSANLSSFQCRPYGGKTDPKKSDTIGVGVKISICPAELAGITSTGSGSNSKGCNSKCSASNNNGSTSNAESSSNQCSGTNSASQISANESNFKGCSSKCSGSNSNGTSLNSGSSSNKCGSTKGPSQLSGSGSNSKGCYSQCMGSNKTTNGPGTSFNQCGSTNGINKGNSGCRSSCENKGSKVTSNCASQCKMETSSLSDISTAAPVTDGSIRCGSGSGANTGTSKNSSTYREGSTVNASTCGQGSTAQPKCGVGTNDSTSSCYRNCIGGGSTENLNKSGFASQCGTGTAASETKSGFTSQCGIGTAASETKSGFTSQCGTGTAASETKSDCSRGCLESNTKASSKSDSEIKNGCAKGCTVGGESKLETELKTDSNKRCSACAAKLVSESKPDSLGGSTETSSACGASALTTDTENKKDCSRGCFSSTSKISDSQAPEYKPDCSRGCSKGKSSSTGIEMKSDCSSGCLGSSSKVTTVESKLDLSQGCLRSTSKPDTNLAANKCVNFSKSNNNSQQKSSCSKCFEAAQKQESKSACTPCGSSTEAAKSDISKPDCSRGCLGSSKPPSLVSSVSTCSIKSELTSPTQNLNTSSGCPLTITCNKVTADGKENSGACAPRGQSTNKDSISQSAKNTCSVGCMRSTSSASSVGGILKQECKGTPGIGGASPIASCAANTDTCGTASLGTNSCGSCSSSKKKDSLPSCSRGCTALSKNPSDLSKKCITFSSEFLDNEEKIKKVLRQVEEDAENVCQKEECGTEPTLTNPWTNEKINELLKDSSSSHSCQRISNVNSESQCKKGSSSNASSPETSECCSLIVFSPGQFKGQNVKYETDRKMGLSVWSRSESSLQNDSSFAGLQKNEKTDSVGSIVRHSVTETPKLDIATLEDSTFPNSPYITCCIPVPNHENIENSSHVFDVEPKAVCQNEKKSATSESEGWRYE